MPRHVNAHAYVNAGFLAEVSADFKITGVAPRIVYAGVGAEAAIASKTGAFLVGKSLKDPATLTDAIAMLTLEMPAVVHEPWASPEYRGALRSALFYKFVLSCLGDAVSDPRLLSAAADIKAGRPVSTGAETFDDGDPGMYPVSKPMTKLTSLAQVAGEAHYTDDLPTAHGELHSAYVLSTVGDAVFGKLDTSAALMVCCGSWAGGAAVGPGEASP